MADVRLDKFQGRQMPPSGPQCPASMYVATCVSAPYLQCSVLESGRPAD